MRQANILMKVPPKTMPGPFQTKPLPGARDSITATSTAHVRTWEPKRLTDILTSLRDRSSQEFRNVDAHVHDDDEGDNQHVLYKIMCIQYVIESSEYL